MPRPSLKAERRAQILAAFGRCLARYGVEGATMERVADEAGLARALIRHNVGNRDAVLDAFVGDFVEQARVDTEALRGALPDKDRAETLVDWLFDARAANAESAAIGAALLAVADQHPSLKAAMQTWNEAFVSALAEEFQNEGAGDAQAAREIAVGVTALYANLEALSGLDADGAIRRDSHAAAKRLLSTL